MIDRVERLALTWDAEEWGKYYAGENESYDRGYRIGGKSSEGVYAELKMRRSFHNYNPNHLRNKGEPIYTWEYIIVLRQEYDDGRATVKIYSLVIVDGKYPGHKKEYGYNVDPGSAQYLGNYILRIARPLLDAKERASLEAERRKRETREAEKKVREDTEQEIKDKFWNG